jgi:hypothetical protein
MSRKDRIVRTAKIGEDAFIPEISQLPRNGHPLSSRSDPEDTAAKTRVAGILEPFVTAKEAANFLCLTVRRVLEMARVGQLPAHPLGVGPRRTWRFRLSELAHALVANNSLSRSGTMIPGSPSGPRQEK